jgi:hypothetical protein
MGKYHPLLLLYIPIQYFLFDKEAVKQTLNHEKVRKIEYLVLLTYWPQEI